MTEPDLAKLIADLKTPSWKFWVSRVRAIEALGALGPIARDAVPLLIALASKPGCDPELLGAAVTALGQIGPAAQPAVPFLVGVINACGKMIERPLNTAGSQATVIARIAGPKFLRWSATQAVGRIVGKPWKEDDASTTKLLLWWEQEGNREAVTENHRGPELPSSPNVNYKGREVTNGNTYEIYTAPSRVVAISFLRNIEIREERKYVVIETREGNVGKDLVMIFDEANSERIEFGIRRPLPKLAKSKTNCTKCGYPVLPARTPVTGTKELILLNEMMEKGVGFFCAGCSTAWCPFCVSGAAPEKCGICGLSMSIYRE